MPSSIIFIGLVILIYFLTHIKKGPKSDKIFLFLSFLIFFILVASRELTVGNDTQNYLRLFRDSAAQGFNKLSINQYYETGFVLFNIILGAINPSPRFFLIVTSLIINLAVYLFVRKNSKNYLLSVLMYIGLLFFFDSMSMIRQLTAASIVLLSIDFAKKQRFLPFILLVILASTIHTSALAALLLYIPYAVKITTKKIILIGIIGILTTIFAGNIADWVFMLAGRTNYHAFTVGNVHVISVVNTIIYASAFVTAYIISHRRHKRNSLRISEETSANLMILLLVAVFSTMSINMGVLDRVAIYFKLPMLAALPNLIEDEFKDYRYKTFINICVMVLLVAYSTTVVLARPEWNSAFRYKSCLIPQDGYICE